MPLGLVSNIIQLEFWSTFVNFGVHNLQINFVIDLMKSQGKIFNLCVLVFSPAKLN